MRRGGLYSNFVSEDSTLYRGAEIAPPPDINRTTRAPMHMQDKPIPGISKHGYSPIDMVDPNDSKYEHEMVKKRMTEEDYFNDDCDDGDNNVLKEDSDRDSANQNDKEEEEEEEEDSLDAFMSNLEKDVRKSGLDGVGSNNDGKTKNNKKNMKGVRQDLEDMDDEEKYYKWLAENPNRNDDEDDNLEIEYDSEGNPIYKNTNKTIQPLSQVDHSTIQYKPFTKVFYTEHSDIRSLNNIQVIDLQQKLGVHVSGVKPPKPVSSFGHFGFDKDLLNAVRKAGFTQPTPIQSQGIPILLSGRDMIGIAQTGSGKTATFIWPMLIHIMDQDSLKREDGPIGLVLVPTRELALQIYTEAKKFGSIYNLSVVCAYGGGSKWEQSQDLERGAEIVIATPGRLIDLLKMKNVTNLRRVTYLVLDEADRMFDLGFEAQVRSICMNVRADRQTSLFSATFKKRIERLARDVLVDPIRVVQGDKIGQAAESVNQVVMVMEFGGHKWQWLLQNIVRMCSEGSVLIFVTRKQNCEELTSNLQLKDLDVKCIHGDLHQSDRNSIITDFKNRKFSILVATDVCARGLDIPHIRNVVNFDVARDVDTHTHRVGRTGRAGLTGTAYTLLTEKDKEFAGHIVRNLESVNQAVPGDVMKLALSSAWFKSSRQFDNNSGGNARRRLKQDRSGLGSESGEVEERIVETVVKNRPTFESATKEAYKSRYTSNFCKAASSSSFSDEKSLEMKSVISSSNSTSSVDQRGNIVQSVRSQKETENEKRDVFKTPLPVSLSNSSTDQNQRGVGDAVKKKKSRWG